jgi:HipA-like protein
MRSGQVLVNGNPAGELVEENGEYRFSYLETYLAERSSPPVSLTLPKRRQPFTAERLFSFFAGLLTEGMAMQLQCRQLKIDENDLFGRLLKTAHSDVIGNVTVHETTTME